MRRPSGEDDPRTRRGEHLRPLRASNAVGQRDPRFTVTGSRLRRRLQFRIRKFSCTHASRAAGIATDDESCGFQARRPETKTSPFGGGGARATWAATDSITRGRPWVTAPRSVVLRFVRFRTPMRMAKRRPRMQPMFIPSGPEEPSPHKRLLGPLSVPVPATKGFTVCAPPNRLLTVISHPASGLRWITALTGLAERIVSRCEQASAGGSR
jgi:hypothetical protein